MPKCNTCGQPFVWPNQDPVTTPNSNTMPFANGIQESQEIPTQQVFSASSNEPAYHYQNADTNFTNPVIASNIAAIDEEPVYTRGNKKLLIIIISAILVIALTIVGIFVGKKFLKKHNSSPSQIDFVANDSACFDIEITEFTNKCKSNVYSVAQAANYSFDNPDTRIKTDLKWDTSDEGDFKVYTTIIDTFSNKMKVKELNNKVYSIEIQFSGGEGEYGIDFGWFYFVPATIMTLTNCNMEQADTYQRTLSDIIADSKDYYVYNDILFGEKTDEKVFVFYLGDKEQLSAIRGSDSASIAEKTNNFKVYPDNLAYSLEVPTRYTFNCTYAQFIGEMGFDNQYISALPQNTFKADYVSATGHYGGTVIFKTDNAGNIIYACYEGYFGFGDPFYPDRESAYATPDHLFKAFNIDDTMKHVFNNSDKSYDSIGYYSNKDGIYRIYKYTDDRHFFAIFPMGANTDPSDILAEINQYEQEFFGQ